MNEKTYTPKPLPPHFVMVRGSRDPGDRIVEIEFREAPIAGRKWVAEYRDGILVGCDGGHAHEVPEGVDWRDCLYRADQALEDAEEEAEDARALRDYEEG